MTEHGCNRPHRWSMAKEITWTAHPRFADIRMKSMLTSAANPLASVSRVRVPPGGVVSWHPPQQTERYVLTATAR